MDWKKKAITLLEDSLYPIPTELNELDWKCALSTKTERLAEHLCAFSNYKGGGILVFGINNDGSFTPLTKTDIDNIIQKLGNIAHNNLSSSISIEHAVLTYQEHSMLFIYIPEQSDKPIHKKGSNMFDAYTRSAGSTIKMSRSQIKSLIADSQGTPFEKRHAKQNLTVKQVLTLLNYRKLYQILDKTIPNNTQIVMELLVTLGYCTESLDAGKWDITNLGALLFANDIKDFEELSSHSVIVRIYEGNNNLKLLHEQIGTYGYAIGFDGLIDYVMKHSSTENIKVARILQPTYPLIAIREFIANALVHQDFSIPGMAVTIEIFKDRIVITNPGSPLGDINRLIDMPPLSRNEQLAQAMFFLRYCERRGSGIDRAVEAIEQMLLPAVKFTKNALYTRIFLYPRKRISDMTKQEKVMACYQHACLSYESNNPINNLSVRERFGLDKNKSAVASRIISDTLEAHLIKVSDESITSKKYATYVPYYV
ncbi:divergent AAA domain protein [Prevotella sp. DNF00663]|uniref:ATP-binding protein n=1 Tax=unclassified Prevotella TaxID=2638335 RepID=UPI0005138B0F|nr:MULTISPECIES: ATP-binding protein [unclassified Prevotella]KGI60854.1 ATPase AAA [Prevotella sp. S7 MS 2]KXB85287.1 divergent AAA domain protein [Prevotella sp. DNF00663]